MKECIIAFMLLFILFTCSNLSTLSGNEDDPGLFKACEQVCKQRYSDTYGIKQYRKLANDLVCCECMRHRGDVKLYINLEEFQSNDDVKIDVEVFKP